MNQPTPSDMAQKIIQQNQRQPSMGENQAASPSSMSAAAGTSAAVPEAQTEEKSAEVLSPKYAALAREQKALRLRQRKLEERERMIQEKESKYQSESFLSKDALREKAKSDFGGILEELGLTPDQAATFLLSQPQQLDPTILEMKKSLQTQTSEFEKLKKQIEESQTKSYEQAVSEIRKDVKHLVGANEEFELIKSTGSEETVVEFIRQYHETSGELLSTEEAAKQVEEYLFEQTFPLMKLKKIQAKWNEPSPSQDATTDVPSQLGATAPSTAQASQPQGARNGNNNIRVERSAQSGPEPFRHKHSVRTLTNATGTTSKPLTYEERRQRAILRAQGKI